MNFNLTGILFNIFFNNLALISYTFLNNWTVLEHITISCQLKQFVFSVNGFQQPKTFKPMALVDWSK